MKYKKIVDGTFLDRPNRFIAHVLINGKKEIVHVRNTGRCRELLIPNAKLLLEDCSHVEGRKTKYSLVSVWKNHTLVNMDSQIPNQVVFEAIEGNQIRSLENPQVLKKEVTYGSSRFDIYFERDSDKGFIEVKGVTLERDGIAIFPDAPTERGRKHVEEMVRARKEGYRIILFFLIQMKGPKLFRLNWEMDKSFSQSVKDAQGKGLEILAFDSIVDENNIRLGRAINIDI